MPFQQLTNRCLIKIEGEDASHFLQNLVTANIEQLDINSISPCALLTPQGKIAFDFLIGKSESDAFFLDIRSELADDILKRLQLYKLRAKIDISIDRDTPISAIWEEPAKNALADTRFAANANVSRQYGTLPKDITQGDFASVRVLNLVAESGEDFELNDIFPHDIGYDLNGAIDFQKGCYVGQEVVSRMKHRGTARKRPVMITSPNGFDENRRSLTADEKTLGDIGTIVAQEALAIVRLDRAKTAMENNIPIMAGKYEVALGLTVWDAPQGPEAMDVVGA